MFKFLVLTAIVTVPSIADNICDLAVSNVFPLTNERCHDRCLQLKEASGNIFTDPYFNEWCHIEAYGQTDSRLILPVESCYDHKVYGYADLKHPNLTGYRHEITKSPAECQHVCQQDDICYHFLWFKGDSAGRGWCFLKVESQVEGAKEIVLEEKYPPAMDYRYNPEICPPDQNYLCNVLDAVCYPEDGLKRCVWERQDIVGGPKYCGKEGE
eukprot:Blabericola_migrator_1__6099@NODE_307_length_10081_cov_93_692830_g251_i0_p7_GENE_NODE_307_length_10081_cov_93_692830_g251_i0NODE_307_length_10081_cov_93_692830_g251_i0_p7_ORF_typecomplete_len212_score16_77PAN_4/PF14295_6/2_1e03PAN_4/PF14295_6/6_3e05PAN_1/PF00024_26/1_9e02PAN_1/PF00024_26/0_00014_NODE_307_length_10081_cov_93_692830_g251_i023803015